MLETWFNPWDEVSFGWGECNTILSEETHVDDCSRCEGRHVSRDLGSGKEEYGRVSRIDLVVCSLPTMVKHAEMKALDILTVSRVWQQPSKQDSVCPGARSRE